MTPCAFRQRNPAHHAAYYGVFPRKVQQPRGLLQSLPRLHHYRSFDPEMVHQRLQILGKEVSPDGAHLRTDPAVLGCGVLPKMVMRVDHAQRPYHALSRELPTC